MGIAYADICVVDVVQKPFKTQVTTAISEELAQVEDCSTVRPKLR